MVKQEMCMVVYREERGHGLYALTMRAPGIASEAKPGQFLHIACGEGSTLRRPISICDVQGDLIKIYFQVKGDGTAWLARRNPRDVIDTLGPLGHGFELDALGPKPVMIGGGIGVPPMLYTMRAAKQGSCQPSAILGFRSRNVVILQSKFEELGRTHICTDDGTSGFHGFVSQLLDQQIHEYTGVCACGPRPMLKAVAEVAEKAGLPCQVSLEERMGCGIGACLVCACELKLKDGQEGVRYGHVCKDGPVFDAKEVVW